MHVNARGYSNVILRFSYKGVDKKGSIKFKSTLATLGSRPMFVQYISDFLTCAGNVIPRFSFKWVDIL